MTDALRPYQEVGRDFLASKTRALLADEMRVGKTPQAILAARKVDAKRILVVCPAIAVPQWVNELKRWGGYEAMNIAKRGTDDYVAGCHIIVSSYDRAANNKDWLCDHEWDVLVVDEGHYCKNPRAQRTRMVYGKDGIGYGARHIWTLSGTPAPNHAGELYPMLAAFGAVKMSYSAYCKRYCYLDHTFKPIGTKRSAIPELKEILGKVMLRRTRKDVAPEMPAIGFDFLAVQPDLNHIDALMREANVTEIDARGQIAELQRLFAAGVTPERLEASAPHFIAARVYTALAKVTALADEIQFSIAAGLYKQTVVFGFYTMPIKLLAETLKQRGIDAETIYGGTPEKRRQVIQNRFKEGRCEVICANLVAAGTAIDLSMADHGYFIELDWVPGNNMQAANRLVSMMKNTPVTFDVVTWAGSPDEHVQRSLARKVSELSNLY